jgi:hypothetical protein
MSLQEKFNNLQGGMLLAPGDSRYAGLAQQTGADPGRNIRIAAGDPSRDRNFELNDPSRYVRGDGYGAYAENNMTPGMSRGEEQRWNYGALIASALAPIAAGAATGAFAGGAGLGGAGLGGADAVTAAEWFGGPGAATNPSAGLFGSVGADAGTGLLGGESGAFDMGGSNGFGGSTPLDAGAPVTDLSTPAQSNGLLDQGRGLLDRAGNWVMNNPLRALSLGHTAYGLLNRNGSNGGAPGGSGAGSKQGGGTSLSGPPTQRPQWTPNPYLQAQLQRGGYL